MSCLPGQAGATPAEPAATRPGPLPANVTAADVDPVAQVEQYEAPPVRTDAPAPYHADSEPAPRQTP